MTRALARPLLGPVPGPVLGAVLALVLLAGCGSAEQGSGDESNAREPASPSSSASSSVGGCAASDAAQSRAQIIAKVDLDGDGTSNDVGLTGPDDACPSLLSVVVAGGDVSTSLSADQPPVRTAFGVDVPGRTGELLVTRQDHPRGGFQLRVYAAGDGKLVELEVDGHSLVPFVALDVQEHPLSVDCTNGGVVITEAVAHEPPGVMFTWDVRRTPYAVEGTGVTAGRTEEIADNVLPGQLDVKYPDLVTYAAFKSCRSGN